MAHDCIIPGRSADWNEIARAMGRDMAQTFFKHVPQPLTTENVQAVLKPAAAAAFAVFERVSVEVGGREAVNVLTQITVAQMIESINDLLAAETGAKH